MPPICWIIPHGPAQIGGGHLQPEGVPGLQQDTLRRHQALAHRPVGGLAEIAAFGVLQMGPAGGEGDAHIGDRGAGEDPQVGLLLEVGENQSLPVPVQAVLGADAAEHKAAAPLPRLQQQPHLGVVAEGLVVATPSYVFAMVSR